MPQIDIMKSSSKTYISNFWGNISEKDGINKFIDSIPLFKAKGKSFVFELEWAENLLIWRINNIEIGRQTQGVPSEEMYLSLSCGLYNETKSNNFPSSMAIDWVKVYQLNS